MGIKLGDIIPKKQIEFEDLSGKKIAIDFSSYGFPYQLPRNREGFRQSHRAACCLLSELALPGFHARAHALLQWLRCIFQCLRCAQLQMP